MKPTIDLLRKALKKCAEAHKVQCEDWPEDGQLGIKSESVPVVADVKSICRAFCGEANVTETAWGYVTVHLDDAEYAFLPEVDETLLKMSLPYGTEL